MADSSQAEHRDHPLQSFGPMLVPPAISLNVEPLRINDKNQINGTLGNDVARGVEVSEWATQCVRLTVSAHSAGLGLLL